MFSAQLGRVDATEFLLRSGADPNMVDSDGCSPVFYAIRAGHEPVLRALHQHGAALSHRDSKSVTPLILAAACGATQCLAYILAQRQISSLVHHGLPEECVALELVIASWSAEATTGVDDRAASEILRLLVQRGADSHLRELCRGPANPIISAVTRGFVATTELIATLCPTSSFRSDPEGQSPLHHALRRQGATEEEVAPLVEVLARCGADVTAMDAHGITPLMLAGERGWLECLRSLLQRCPPSQLSDVCNTPMRRSSLHYTLASCPTDRPLLPCVRALLQAGADSRLRDGEGFTPLMLAAQRGLSGAVHLILQHTCPSPHEAHEEGFREVRCKLSDDSGKTAVHLVLSEGACASDEEAQQCVKLLHAYHATVTEADADGRTPLMLAAGQGFLTTVMYLLYLLEQLPAVEALTALEAVDTNGRTALHHAAEEMAGIDRVRLEVIKAILAAHERLQESSRRRRRQGEPGRGFWIRLSDQLLPAYSGHEEGTPSAPTQRAESTRAPTTPTKPEDQGQEEKKGGNPPTPPAKMEAPSPKDKTTSPQPPAAPRTEGEEKSPNTVKAEALAKRMEEKGAPSLTSAPTPEAPSPKDHTESPPALAPPKEAEGEDKIPNTVIPGAPAEEQAAPIAADQVRLGRPTLTPIYSILMHFSVSLISNRARRRSRSLHTIMPLLRRTGHLPVAPSTLKSTSSRVPPQPQPRLIARDRVERSYRRTWAHPSR
jgi:ankyrin repeat protein